jgi:hypothetical protein
MYVKDQKAVDMTLKAEQYCLRRVKPALKPLTVVLSHIRFSKIANKFPAVCNNDSIRCKQVVYPLGPVTMLAKVIEFILNYLANWEEGDPRSAIIHIQPSNINGKLQVRFTWAQFKAEICIDHLNRFSFPYTDPRNCFLQGLKAIAESSGYGKISINPRRKAQPRATAPEFIRE